MSTESRRQILYLASTISLIFILYLISDSQWVGSKALHTLMEVVATLLALFVGIVALVHYYAKKTHTFLFIGTGFLGTALLDGYHAVVTSTAFDLLFPSPPESLIPWSWSASRLFLAMMLYLSYLAWKYRRKFITTSHHFERRVYTVSITLTVVSFLFFIFLPLPQAYYDSLIGRPQEYIPGLIFLLTLIGYYQKKRWVTSDFEHWLMLALIVNTISQMTFMSLSHTLFDQMFDSAHLLKKVSYILVLTGLLYSMSSLFKEAFGSRAKDHFLATMSHELRTPLTSILGNTELLREKLVVPELLENVKQIEIAGKIQLNLVNDILDMSKIESGKFSIDEHQYNLHRLISDIYSIMSIRFKDKDVLFRTDGIIDEKYKLYGDSGRIGQILINLLSNAIKFTETGYVSLEIKRINDEWLDFVVTDTGIGMSQDDVSMLFRKFVQTDISISRRHGGTGLGLYISYNLAQMMGGDITAISEKDKGSTFTLRLPYKLTDTLCETNQEHLQKTNQEKIRYSGRVLVAEDTTAIQMVIRKILEGKGLEVIIVGDGKQAIEQAMHNTYDIILMDMQMPVMGGVEATSILREKNITTPIYAFTANVMVRDRELFYAAGCDGFISKPIDKEALYETLSKHLFPVLSN